MLRWLLDLLRRWIFGGARVPTPSRTEPPPAREWRRFQPLSLKRFDGAGKPPPLHWKPCHPRTAHLFKAEITCEHGHGIVLGGHEIRTDGSVDPSVVCKAPGCRFHTFVKLAGWRA
jgi:hypothetical protein